MLVNNKLHIKQNIIDSDVFVVDNRGGQVTIYKNIYHMSPYFECICICNYSDDKAIYGIDRIEYDATLNRIRLHNTRRAERNQDTVTSEMYIKDKQSVSLYTFGIDSILLILEKEEK